MTIDADAHVMECQETWDYLTGHEARFRPQAITTPDNRKRWLIDGQFFPCDAGDETMSLAVRTLGDVPGRLALMDSYGVDIQVLYPTVFQKCRISKQPEVATALCRSYNHWIGEACAASDGRLRWVMIPPLLDMRAAVDEIKWAKDHGACGIFVRGIEDECLIDDPSFDPIYRAAVEVDLPICVHTGSGNEVFQKLAYPRDLFLFVLMPVLAAFRRILTTSVMANYRDLRFGFLQAGAQWVPYLLSEAKRELSTTNENPVSVEDLLNEQRLYVACRTDDDLEKILTYGFSKSLVLGTDFSHLDPTTELDAHATLATRHAKLGPENIAAIDHHNAAALYGLSNRT